MSRLSGLRQVVGGLLIENNDLLPSLSGFESLASVGSLTITNNTQLSTCATEPICQLLRNLPTGSKVVSGNAPGCATLAEVEANCAGLTITDFAASPNPVCVGSPITFTATVSNVSPPYAFTLSNGTSSTMGNAGSTAFSQMLVASGTGSQAFTLTVSANSFTASTTTSVTVNAAPSATISYPGSPFLTSGGPVNVNQTGTAGGTYNSNPTGLSLNTGTGQIMPANSSPGNYTVTYTITASGGCAAFSTTAAVGIQGPQADLRITCTDGQASVLAGGSITYTITVSNSGPSNAPGALVADTFPATLTDVNWTAFGAGGATVSAAGTGNINESVNLPAGGSVTFTVMATVRSSATGNLSNTATVTAPAGVTDPNPNNNSATDTDIITPATPTIANFAASPNPVCVGSPITFTATVGNVSPPYAFTLSNGTSSTMGNAGSTAFSQMLVASGTGSQAFTLTVSSNGASQTATTTVTVNALPVAGLTNNGPLTCSQTSVMLTATPVGQSYVFSSGATQVGGSAGNTATVSAAGTYSVTVSDVNGCMATANTTVTSTSAVILASLTASGAISCASTSVTLTAAPGGLGYVFSAGATQIGTSNQATVMMAGTYSVTVTGGGGCSAVAQVTVTGSSTAPAANLIASGSLSCTATSVTLTAATGGTTYAFSSGATQVGGSAGNTATVSTAGTYSVVITGSNACTASAAVTVTGSTTAPTASLVSSGTLTCSQTSVTLTAAPGGSSYAFSSGATQIGGSAGNTATVNVAGTYSVTVTNASGCVSTTSTTVISLTAGAPARLYVNDDATGANTGLSWADAFTDLQSALTYSCRQNLTEIWIARGVYKPSQTGVRAVSFQMLPDVAIYGGFNGGEMDLIQRPPITPDSPSSTTLSGDLDSDGTNANNSNAIINNRISLTSTAILDGAVITGPSSNSPTGAIVNQSGSSNLGNVCSPTIRNCLFINNGLALSGGVYNLAFGSAATTSPTLINCVFKNNQSIQGTIENTVTDGGTANPLLINCLFTDNTRGSAVDNQIFNGGQTRPQLVNCSFLNNPSGVVSGGITQGTTGTIATILTNCVLFNNNGSNPFPGQTSPNTSVTVENSLLEASVTGFANGGNNRTTVASPFVSATNLRLPACSPGIDAGLNSANGLNGITKDVADNPRRFNNGVVDMGAYEFQGTCPTPVSNSACGSPVETLGQAFTLVAPTYDCATGIIKFNTTGGDGSTITYRAIGIVTQTTSCTDVVDTQVAQDIRDQRSNVQPFTLLATQNGVTVGYIWDALAACSGSTGTPPASNSAPVAPAVGPQSATVGQAFSFVVPAFSDPNGDALTYSATGLPANGLIFNPTNRTISGTPSTTGTVNVTVTATDPGSLSASVSFTITISPAGGSVTPPTGGSFTLTQPTYNCQTGAITFNTSGGDGTAITYQAVGVSRPGNTGNSGTVEAGLRSDPKPLNISATQSGVTVTYVFDFGAFCAGPTSNSAPVAPAVGPQSATVGQAFSFVVPVFSDPNGDALTYSATGLPANGLSFNGSNRTISGTPSTTGTVTVTITATDPGNLSASTSFTITISPAGGSVTPPTGGSFTLTQPTYNCQTGAITFNTSGGDGTAITYQAVGVSRPGNTGNSGMIEAGLRSDPKPLNISATQSGVTVTYVFDFAAFCAGPTSNSAPVAPVVGPQSATVGQAFSFVVPAFSDPNGDALTYTATGLPANGLSFNGSNRTISGTPSTTGTVNVTVTGTDPGNLSAQTSFVITISPAGGSVTPPSGSFTLTQPTYNCQTGAITFNTSGGDGTAITYRAVGVSRPGNTGNTGTIEAGLRSDPKPLNISATQSGVTVTYVFDFAAFCANGGSRQGVEPAEALQVTVFGNPTQSETVEVEIRGAAGQSLQLNVVSAQGTLVSELTVNRAGVIERQTVRLGSEAGVYLLTISSGTQRQTVKIVRQ